MTFDAFISAERNGWHSRAEIYATHTAYATLQIVPAMLDALGLRPGMRMLDVACGPGYVAGAAAALEMDVQGIDYATGMIAAAQKRFPDLSFKVGDAEALPFADADFDAVACNMGLFHMADPLQAMREAGRVLRNGGRFSFSQWAAPGESTLYGLLFAALKETADLSRADPAPDAYVLSDVKVVQDMLSKAGFTDIKTTRLETVLIAHGADFFDFFMKFGVRVPLIVGAQNPDVQQRLRDRINADMAPFATNKGFEVPMPSLLYTGTKK
ncbi:methyltransferase domain-containing protein [Sulfitobacter sp. F26204]|uniref:class I SAM-dependent methyltransferase n=1 Tax=Sulfitobacter sp. F26204 TaxID=2996014 RepID=UPI00225DE242|nr:methyltransferase domain-containing protein [Sulfitobacter sp. F26204]MCX7558406.1 methyltransferase domain-containing protein [Sulfitobacter sp. F26204]